MGLFDKFKEVTKKVSEVENNIYNEKRDYLEIYHNETKVVMSHYPMAAWHQSYRGSGMLHGHLHDRKSGLEEYRVRNVGFDYTGKVVSKLDDVIADALLGKKREF